MNIRTRVSVLLPGLLTVLLTGCSSVNTPPERVALHYSGGSLSSQKFQDCIPASTRDFKGPGEQFYQYVTQQVIYDASSEDGAERGRFAVVSKDSADLLIPVSVTLTLVTECNTLRQFHETLGKKYAAYWTGEEQDGESPGGWVKMLNTVIGKPLDATLDRIALNYDWQAMRSDPKVKADIERQINDEIAELVERQAGGVFFENFSALVQKPDPVDPALLSAIAQKQARVAQAEAQEAEANAQVETAKAQERQARAEAARQRAEILGYRLPGMTPAEALRAYNEAKAIESGQNPYQPQYVIPGTPAPGPAPAPPAEQ